MDKAVAVVAGMKSVAVPAEVVVRPSPDTAQPVDELQAAAAAVVMEQRDTFAAPVETELPAVQGSALLVVQDSALLAVADGAPSTGSSLSHLRKE